MQGDIQLLDDSLRHLAKLIEHTLGIDVEKLPGAGAAGGVGAALVAFCQAKIQSGVDTLLDLFAFDQSLSDADVVITGEGRTDVQTKFGKVVLGVAWRAALRKVNVVCVSGALGDDLDFLYGAGVTACFSICSRPMVEEDAMQQAYPLLQKTIENVVRLYISPNFS